MMKISVIIPVKPGEETRKALGSLRHIDYPRQLFEIFVGHGTNPSRQRNEMVKKSQGEILYFLDSDSEIDSKAFRRVEAILNGKITSFKTSRARGFSLFPEWFNQTIIQNFFSRKIFKGEIGAVGGPNVWWRPEIFWASMTGAILESFFAHSLMAARYRPIGPIHRASEKELILCNLAMRRDVFEKMGGFHEALYPNEENELLNRIRKAGYQLVYHPGVIISRPRRQTFNSLLSAFFHYGRGRMEQVKVEGPLQSLLFFAPLFLLFYLLGLIFYHPWYAFIPLVLYLVMALGSAIGYASRKKKLSLIAFLPPIFLIAHLSYAFGGLYGLTTNLEEKKQAGKKTKIEVVKIKSFDQANLLK